MTKAPPRPSMSKARRLRIWERDKGVCYLCGLKVAGGEPWEAEHISAWGLSFDDSDQNLAVAHKAGCHAQKTKDDVRRIIKAKKMAGELGQRARRAKHGPSLKSGPSNWPKGRKLESRPFDKRKPK